MVANAGESVKVRSGQGRGANRPAARASKARFENLSGFGLRTTLALRTRQAGNGATVAAAACVAGRSEACHTRRVAACGGELAEAPTFGAQSASAAPVRDSPPAATLFFCADAMKINLLRLDHVQVCIPHGSEEQAREFYGRLLASKDREARPAQSQRRDVVSGRRHSTPHRRRRHRRQPSNATRPSTWQTARGVRAYLEQRGVPTRDEPDIPGVVHRFSFFDRSATASSF